MAEDVGPNYDVYSAAMRRVINGITKESTPAWDADKAIISAGDPQFGKQFDTEYNQPPPGSAANSIPNVATRVASNAAFAVPDFLGGAINTVANLAEKYGLARPGPSAELAPNATPEARAIFERTRVPIVSQEARNVLSGATGGVVGQEMPADAGPLQQLGEGALSAVAGGGGRSALNAVSKAYDAASALPVVSRIANAGTAGIRSLLGSSVTPTVGSYYGSKVAGEYGGPEWAPVGGMVGGAAALARPAMVRAGEQLYAGSGRPDAVQVSDMARYQGVTPSAGMLGNPQIQALEKELSATRGSGKIIGRAQTTADEGIAAAADRAASERGAVTARPEPGTIGGDILSAADDARQNLKGTVSQIQQNLEDRIGSGTQVSASNLLHEMRRSIYDPTGQLRTSPETARPVLDRIAQVEQMQNPQTGTVRYDALKDFRSELGRGTQNVEPLRGQFLDRAYGAATDTMGNAALGRNVPLEDFNRTQDITRQIEGSGGPLPYFKRIAGEPGTSGEQVGSMSPQQAFSHVIKGGEQSPERLAPFEKYAPQQFDQIMGDALRHRIQQTVESGRAPGMDNFARWWNNLTPEAQRMYGGGTPTDVHGGVRPDVQMAADLAAARNYPTSTSGLTKAIGGQTEGLAGRLVGSEMLAEAARAINLPSWVGRGAGMFGVIPGIRYARAKMLESDMARRGLTNEFSSPAPSTADIRAALAAMPRPRPEGQ
jgi:hypothetical protein